MIEYLRRYLADPDTVDFYIPEEEPLTQTDENSLTHYLRRYLADPVESIDIGLGVI